YNFNAFSAFSSGVDPSTGLPETTARAKSLEVMILSGIVPPPFLLDCESGQFNSSRKRKLIYRKRGNEMNQLIPTQPNEQGNLLVSGRDLHEFLEVSTEYRKWFGRMADYGFTENVDFIRVTQKCPTPGGMQDIVDHHLKIDMAKEISMLQRNEKGKQARQYFL